MRSVIFMIINPKGVVEVKKNKPSLRANEIAVKVNVIVPDKYFEATNLPEFDLKVTESKIIRPAIKIEADIAPETNPNPDPLDELSNKK